MVTTRTELELCLHRLANHLECQLADIIPTLLAESRVEAVQDILHSGCRLVESLRCVRDGKEGDV